MMIFTYFKFSRVIYRGGVFKGETGGVQGGIIFGQKYVHMKTKKYTGLSGSEHNVRIAPGRVNTGSGWTLIEIGLGMRNRIEV